MADNNYDTSRNEVTVERGRASYTCSNGRFGIVEVNVQISFSKF